MDRATLVELVPHYVAMLLIVFLVLAVVRAAAGELGFWIEFAVILAVVFAYRPVVRWLGYAPRAWED